MAIEILTVSLSDESIDRIVTALHARMQHPQVVTQSNPPSPQNPQGAEPPASAPQADPWQNGGASQTFQPPPAPTTSQAVSVPPQNGPTCVHGAMRYVPSGFSKSTGKAYQAFWGCPAPRGQQQCASVRP